MKPCDNFGLGARPKVFHHVSEFEVNDIDQHLQRILSLENNLFEDGYAMFEELVDYIRKEPISLENTLWMLKCINKLCKISLRSELTKVLQLFVDTTEIRTKVCVYITKAEDDDKVNVFLNTLFSILTLCCDTIPRYSLNTVVILLSVASSLINSSDLYGSLKGELERLEEKQGVIIASVKDNVGRCRIGRYKEPPNDFRTINVMPDASDMLIDAHPFLRKNVIYGPYRDIEHYLDVQFRLLREDFMLPLRGAINQYKQELAAGNQSTFLQDARLYKDVFIQEVVCLSDGLGRKVKFGVEDLSRVNWEKSNRLMSGSLVCVSSNQFQTIAFGIIAERDSDDLAKGIVYVKFDKSTLELIGTNPFEVYEMIEPVAYYESYKYNLSVLKNMHKCDLPMQKYILSQKEPSDEDDAPLYLRNNNVTYDMRCLWVNMGDEDTKRKNSGDIDVDYMENPCDLPVNDSEQSNDALSKVEVLDTDRWPKAKQLGMDQSQLQALKHALTKEFSIIQGPPGTGKTYLGLKMMQVLLNNTNVWSPDTTPTILVVCYTNHALDQFLSGILDMFPAMEVHNTLIRIGGYQKSEPRLINCKLQSKTTRTDKTKRLIGIRNQLSFRVRETSSYLSAIVSGIIHDEDMEMIIGQRNMDTLERQYRYFPPNLQHISIILFWLSMADKRRYKCVHATKKQKKTKKLIEPVQEDDNEDAQRIMADEMKKKKIKCGKTYSNNFQGKVLVTYDDINDNIIGYWQLLAKYIPHFRDVMNYQLLQNEYMSSKETKHIASHQLWRLSEHERWRLYRNWVLQYYEMKRLTFRGLCEEYQDAVETCNYQKRQDEIIVLQKANVIGMTTTGASKYRELLEATEPRIVVIEEAAEILEAHIVTTLTSSCEHVILIGDHQQLRPNPSAYKLAKDYKLDISLFERMVKNNLHLSCLAIQHRMRPEISSCLVPYIYKELKDHSSVHSYPDIKGIKGNFFFINHNEQEIDVEDSRSHSNMHEATFTVALCRYLLRQGYDADEITILTTYKGQQFLIRDVISSCKDLYLSKKTKEEIRGTNKHHRRDVDKDTKEHVDGTNKSTNDDKSHINTLKVVTVDNFQGEENKIIILSLVRSNEKGIVGFLKRSNRICVALSRAKHGFYAIGNMKQLEEASKIWKQILSDVDIKDKVVDSLPLICQNHSDREIKVKCLEDFDNVPEGGCILPCEYRLPCGHACIRECHPYDQEHQYYICKKPCTQLCPEQHPCKNKCFQCFETHCIPCDVIVKRSMPKCSHIQSMKCHKSVDEHICEIECQNILDCGHTCQTICGKECTKNCEVIVRKQLKCGHEKDIQCHIHPEFTICKTMVTVKTCDIHSVDVECTQSEIVSNSPCSVNVTTFCPVNSNHPVIVKCSEFENAKCTKKCDQMMQCGHYCSALCGSCYKKGCHPPCKESCVKVLPCQHKCEGICNGCSEGQHPPCRRVSKETFVCGHINQSLCGFIPSKCTHKCNFQCAHGKCNKLCGDKCEPCRKTCAWECEHNKCTNFCHESCNRRWCNKQCLRRLEQCGHRCQGYCGEPCLHICYECKSGRGMFIDVARRLGYRITRPWGFVRLQPCNHIIEGFFMDNFMKKECESMRENHCIHNFDCPVCKRAILYCPRYSRDMKFIMGKLDMVKGAIAMESYRNNLIFNVPNSQRNLLMTLEKELAKPSEKVLLKCGVVCCLQATLNLYENLENKLKDMSDEKRIKSGPLDSMCDVSMSEIQDARETLWHMTEKVINEDIDSVELKEIAVFSMLCVFRAKVSDLDLFIGHKMKRDIIRKMVYALDKLTSNSNIHTTVELLDKVSANLTEHFTLKQRDGVASLIEQVKHLYTPFLLTQPGKTHMWIECNLGEVHFIVDNKESLNQALSLPNYCDICFKTPHVGVLKELTWWDKRKFFNQQQLSEMFEKTLVRTRSDSQLIKDTSEGNFRKTKTNYTSATPENKETEQERHSVRDYLLQRKVRDRNKPNKVTKMDLEFKDTESEDENVSWEIMSVCDEELNCIPDIELYGEVNRQPINGKSDEKPTKIQQKDRLLLFDDVLQNILCGTEDSLKNDDNLLSNDATKIANNTKVLQKDDDLSHNYNDILEHDTVSEKFKSLEYQPRNTLHGAQADQKINLDGAHNIDIPRKSVKKTTVRPIPKDTRASNSAKDTKRKGGKQIPREETSTDCTKKETTRDTYDSRKETTRNTSGSRKETTRDTYGSRKETTRDTYGARKETTMDTYGARKETTRDTYGSRKETTKNTYGSKKQTTMNTDASRNEATRKTDVKVTIRNSVSSKKETVRYTDSSGKENTWNSVSSRKVATENMDITKATTSTIGSFKKEINRRNSDSITKEIMRSPDITRNLTTSKDQSIVKGTTVKSVSITRGTTSKTDSITKGTSVPTTSTRTVTTKNSNIKGTTGKIDCITKGTIMKTGSIRKKATMKSDSITKGNTPKMNTTAKRTNGPNDSTSNVATGNIKRITKRTTGNIKSITKGTTRNSDSITKGTNMRTDSIKKETSKNNDRTGKVTIKRTECVRKESIRNPVSSGKGTTRNTHSIRKVTTNTDHILNDVGKTRKEPITSNGRDETVNIIKENVTVMEKDHLTSDKTRKITTSKE